MDLVGLTVDMTLSLAMLTVVVVSVFLVIDKTISR